jgi:hypothetical protein
MDNIAHSPSLIEHAASNLAVEWLAMLFHIKENPGSNLGPETAVLIFVFLNPSSLVFRNIFFTRGAP